MRLGVCVKTLDRRMIEYGLQKYTDILDCDLEEEVRHVLERHPNSGESMLHGHLASRYMEVGEWGLGAGIEHITTHREAYVTVTSL